MDPSLASSRDRAVTVQTPQTRNRSVPSGPSATVTDGLERSDKEKGSAASRWRPRERKLKYLKRIEKILRSVP